MKILKVRHGFATNSSSSHSILIWKGKKPPEDHLVEKGDFGWEYFTAATREAKQRYLGVLLRDAMRENASDEVANAVVQSWLGIDPKKITDAYIDHESSLTIPYEWDGQSPSREFFKDLAAYVLADDVVILGGNDNEKKVHPLESRRNKGFRLAVPRDKGNRRWRGRKDSRGFWTLFDREEGTKVRLVFDIESEIVPSKADTPELVDLKITDYCPYNCAYCYQDSTNKGGHSDNSILDMIVRVLANMRVFEVAIGGGEPTMHPRFWPTLKECVRLGLIPNFTTRNLSWMREPEKVATFVETSGGMAFSVDTDEEIPKMLALAQAAGIPDEKLSIQYVVGSTNYGVSKVVRACHKANVRCTLLGYKTTGRGKKIKPADDHWMTALSDLNREESLPYEKLSVDTALAAGHEAELEALDVPEWCYETKEGKFSMYIDAVALKAGPSSYCEPIRMRKLPSDDPTQAKMEQRLRRAFDAF